MEIFAHFIILIPLIILVILALIETKRDIAKNKPSVASNETKKADKIQAKIIDISESDCIDLALVAWNIEKKINNIENNPHKRPLHSYLSKAKNILSKYKIETLDYTNKTYNEGMNVDILAVEKNPNATCDMIKETISPTITINGEIRKRAQIIKEIKGE